ncbi:MAG: GNAT family N-acetyltransferase [Rhodothermales bacterium]
MPEHTLAIQTMNPSEVELVVDWAAAEGWNPGLHDAAIYPLADPNGFLIGYLGETPVATISVVQYGEGFGFLGFYIVAPAYRGRGYGLQIWKAGIGYLAGRNVGLDGVVEQQANYQKFGFKLAYRNIRYEGQGGGTRPKDARLVALAKVPFEDIQAYARPFFPEDRSSFLKAWITQPHSHGYAVMADGQLQGYGVMRACRTGYKIGPLYADSANIAEALYRALTSRIRASEPVYLDVPEKNPAAVQLAEKYGMHPVFETARMYTGSEPTIPMDRLFGVTSFEIG